MVPTWAERDDYLLCMCRKLVEKDFGTRAGNYKSLSHLIDRFMKEHNEKDNLNDYDGVRKAFSGWLKKIIRRNISDEQVAILVRKYEPMMCTWEKPDKNTASALKNAWIDAIADRTIDLADDYGIHLYTMCGV